MSLSEKQITVKHLTAHRDKLLSQVAGINSTIEAMGGDTTPTVKTASGRKPLTPAQRRAAGERLALARAAKKAKAEESATATDEARQGASLVEVEA